MYRVRSPMTANSASRTKVYEATTPTEVSTSSAAPPIRREAWLLAAGGNLVVRLAGLVSAIMLARSLGPSGRGIVTEATLWPTIVVSCGAVMNAQTATYFASRAGQRGFHACLLIGALVALALFPMSLAIGWAALGAQGKQSYGPSLLYSLIVPLSLLTNAFAGPLLARGNVGGFWMSRALPGLVAALGTIALAALHMLTPLRFVVISVLGAALTLAAMAWRQRRDLSEMSVPDSPLLRDVAIYGGTTALVMLPYQLNLRLDQLLLSVLASEHSLGLYAVATAWSSMLSVIGSGFSTVVLAHSTRVDATDIVATLALFRKVRKAVLLVIVAGVLAAIAAPIGLPLLYGSNFSGAIAPALVLCVASIPLYANIVLHEFARGLGLPGAGVRPEVAGLAINVVGLSLMIPRYGPMGAAVASLLSYTMVSAMMLPAIVRRIPGSSLAMLVPRYQDARDVIAAAIWTVSGLRGATSTRDRAGA
jgi:O-antigen/teichoic acid export membrane protein